MGGGLAASWLLGSSHSLFYELILTSLKPGFPALMALVWMGGGMSLMMDKQLGSEAWGTKRGGL